MSEQLTVEKMGDSLSVEMLTGFIAQLSTNKKLNEDEQFFIASTRFLLSQLATIERETVEKCAEISVDAYSEDQMSRYDVSEAIQDHFKLNQEVEK